MTSTTERRGSASSSGRRPRSTSTSPATPRSGRRCSPRSPRAGRRNYSLFLGEGGRLIGYYETDDDEAAQAYLAASPSPRGGRPRWPGFFVGLDGRPDQAATPLTEVFNLQDQLAGCSGVHPDRKHAS